LHRASVVGTVLQEADDGQVQKETREYTAFHKSLVELRGGSVKEGLSWW
jgi:hypothetical protein